MRTRLTVLLAAIAMAPDGGAAFGQCVEVPGDIVSWWPGDGSAVDIADGNDGTLVNGATSATGLVGQAFSFDGVDDHVLIGNPPNLDITDNVTLEAWINTTGVATGSIASIITKWAQHPAEDCYLISLVGTTGGIRLVGGLGDGVNADLGDLQGGTILPNTWHHVAMTYDSGTDLNLIYVDGVQVDDRTRPGGIASSTHKVLIGREDSILPRPFGGLIDEPAIYHRALSAAEIQAIYEAGGDGKCLDDDGDGVPNEDDECDDSDLGETIIINGEDTGVANDLLEDGCSLADLIAEVLGTDPNLNEVVALLVELKGEGVISGQEMGAILRELNDP